jgi:NitT/TauT family transport system substrate-binding protein
VGLTFGSQAQALWISILDAHKLDGSKIKTVNLFPSALQAAYERGEIDAYVLWQPSGYIISRLKPTVRLEDPLQSYFPAAARPLQLNGYYTVIVARDDVIRDKPEAIKAFLRLVDRTNKFITANPAEAAAIIAKDLKVDQSGMEVVLQQTKHDMTANDVLVKDLEAQANQLFAQGRFRAKPPDNLKGWTDFSILKQAFPQYVTVTR